MALMVFPMFKHFLFLVIQKKEIEFNFYLRRLVTDLKKIMEIRAQNTLSIFVIIDNNRRRITHFMVWNGFLGSIHQV